MHIARSLCLLLAFVILQGCSHTQLREVTGTFPGLKRSIDNQRRIKLLVIHGIGFHKPGYAETLGNGIAQELGMVPEFRYSIQEIRRENGAETEKDRHVQTYGYMRIQDYHNPDSDQAMRLYELTWSPTTQTVKDQFLGFDGFGKYQYERIFLNHQLKEQLMNERMSEAVLYVGKYRSEMQYPILWALHNLLEDDFGSGNDEIVIVTSSLASYMIFDTVMSLPLQPDGVVNTDELLSKLNTVIMLANQLPLLLLGEVSQIGSSLGDVPEGYPADEKQKVSWFAYPMLQRFIEMRNASFQKRAPGEAIPDLSLVAINDPNDILSYPLPGYLSVPGDHLNYVNVTLNIARITPITQIANPITAHTGHETNPDVIHYIASGAFLDDTPEKEPDHDQPRIESHQPQ